MTVRVVGDDAAGRAQAVAVLRAGGLVALPTDTVYGIAVAVATPGGVERLFEVKRRPPDRGDRAAARRRDPGGPCRCDDPGRRGVGCCRLAGRAERRRAPAVRRAVALGAHGRRCDDRAAGAGPRRATGAGSRGRAAPDDIGQRVGAAGRTTRRASSNSSAMRSASCSTAVRRWAVRRRRSSTAPASCRSSCASARCRWRRSPRSSTAPMSSTTCLARPPDEVGRGRSAVPPASVDRPGVDDLAIAHDLERVDVVDDRADVVRHDRYDPTDLGGTAPGARSTTPW